MYSEKVMDHFMNPRNVGEIADANGVGEVGNATCGDIMRIYLKINDDGIIEDVKFKTFGCGAGSGHQQLATEMTRERAWKKPMALTNKAVVEALDGSPQKLHCSVLAEEAVLAALEDYARKTRNKMPFAKFRLMFLLLPDRITMSPQSRKGHGR